MASAEQQAEQDIVVDGDPVDLEDLSFAEERELRQVIRGLSGNATVDLDDTDLMDFLPAIVYVFKKRNDPKYELDEALKLKRKDVLKDKPKRPTRAVKAA